MASGSKHSPYHGFRGDLKAPDHPILEGLAASFVTHDELYQGLAMHPGVAVLATAYDDPENRGPGPQGVRGAGKDEPVMWALPYREGRVFTTALGHDLHSVRVPGFAATFRRGAEWAAAGKVTIAPPPGLGDED